MAAPHERRYSDASADRIFAACLWAVAEEGWKIEHTDATMRTLPFGTGMSLRTWAGQRMSVFVDAVDDGTVKVVVGARGETLQFCRDVIAAVAGN